MPEFTIVTIGVVQNNQTVEAGTPEEALSQSEAGGSVQLCNQCTNHWEPSGDTEVIEVLDADGKSVLQLDAGGDMVAPNA